jgi:hypothetical protein
MISIKQLPEDWLTPVTTWLNKASWSYGWHSDKDIPYGHWNVDITRTGIKNTLDITERLPFDFLKIWDHLRPEGAILVRCYANRHTFGTEGYPHTDTDRAEDHTCVIYLNKDWKAEWGGETTFYNPDKTEIIQAIMPKMGRVVTFPGNIPHCARAVSRICPEVRTTLMFKFAVDLKSMYPAEEVLKNFLSEIGAFKKPHKDGSLGNHLLRCFHLMKSVGIGDVLAVAGGLHSVYGTSSYKNACLNIQSKRVEEVFGPEVDSMVRMFSSLKRPEDLMDDSRLDEKDLFLMRCIEVANLYDQGELEDYPHLVAFAAQFK